jgi:hypothetical protein
LLFAGPAHRFHATAAMSKHLASLSKQFGCNSASFPLKQQIYDRIGLYETFVASELPEGDVKGRARKSRRKMDS